MSTVRDTRSVTSTASAMAREAAQDAPEIQGMFLGRSIAVSRKRQRDDGWTSGYSQERGEGPDEDVPLDKRKAQSRSDLRKSEARARARVASSLPDFSEQSELQGFGFLLRRMMRDRDYSSLREEAENFFGDVAVRHGAISAAARMMKDSTGGDPQLQKELQEYAEDLEKQHGPAIRSGYNISRQADETAGGRSDLRQQLRDFYRAFLASPNDPRSLYLHIASFPNGALKANLDPVRTQ